MAVYDVRTDEAEHDAPTESLVIRVPLKFAKLIDVITAAHRRLQNGETVTVERLPLVWDRPSMRTCSPQRFKRPRRNSFAKECICDRLRVRQETADKRLV